METVTFAYDGFSGYRCSKPGDQGGRYVRAKVAEELHKELSHLVKLMEPLELEGGLNIPGLATLNGAREALVNAERNGAK